MFTKVTIRMMSNCNSISSGFAAGIYSTNSAEACLHCALNGQCDIFVVEDRKQLEKVLEIKDKIPTLKAIVQVSLTDMSFEITFELQV